MNKKEVSALYTFSNITLFEDIFYNWEEFTRNLSFGKENMQEYLLTLWNKLNAKLNDDRYVLLDKIENVTKNDFDINMIKSNNDITIFAFTLPERYFKGACKYVALALTDKKPRYFTFEYTDSKDKYVFGEYDVFERGMRHYNRGSYTFNELAKFFALVINVVDEE